MAKFIKLKQANDGEGECYVRADAITGLTKLYGNRVDGRGGTSVVAGGIPHLVRETPEQILKLIEDAK